MSPPNPAQVVKDFRAWIDPTIPALFDHPGYGNSPRLAGPSALRAIDLLAKVVSGGSLSADESGFIREKRLETLVDRLTPGE